MNTITQIPGQPLISVVIPVHNGARWLGETLDSLYAQGWHDFEIVLIDDASTDGLQEVLDHHADPRLITIHLGDNVGVSAARNRGIELARGRYIAFCDADDLCHPQRLARQMAFLDEHPEIGLCGTAFTCFDTEERNTVINPETDAQIRQALRQGNCFGLSTVMARAAVLQGNHFNTGIDVAEDYDLWVRLVMNGVQCANLPESLVLYRLHPGQVSRHKSIRLDQVSRQIRSCYWASLLGDVHLQALIHSGEIGLNDLEVAAQSVAFRAVQTPAIEAREFRFMLAWMYQQLPRHGVRSWLHWMRIQKRLALSLDSNYLLNIALLALLPGTIGRKYLYTLTKLKR